MSRHGFWVDALFESGCLDEARPVGSGLSMSEKNR